MGEFVQHQRDFAEFLAAVTAFDDLHKAQQEHLLQTFDLAMADAADDVKDCVLVKNLFEVEALGGIGDCEPSQFLEFGFEILSFFRVNLPAFTCRLNQIVEVWDMAIDSGTLANVNASQAIMQAVVIGDAAGVFKGKPGGQEFFGFRRGATVKKVELRRVRGKQMLEFRGHFWRKIHQVKGNIVLFGKAIEDGGREFIAGKLWIKNDDTFSGESTLPEHHGCGDTFARAG